ncbi:MAG: LPS export ABC transporter periplasmic protein LptC, partial [Moraxellaceae bacterium]
MPNCTFSHHFQLHPLAAALLVCSLTPLMSATAQADDAQLVDRSTHQSNADNKLSAPFSHANSDPQDYFKQYYLSRDEIEQLPIDRQRQVPATCRGTWVTPFDPNVKADDPEQATSVITADYAYYDPDQGSELNGKVKIDQPGRSIQADKIQLNADQTIASAQGNVQLMDAGLLTQSDKAVYHLNDQTGQVSNSLYISETQRAHGQAELIDRQG